MIKAYWKKLIQGNSTICKSNIQNTKLWMMFAVGIAIIRVTGKGLKRKNLGEWYWGVMNSLRFVVKLWKLLLDGFNYAKLLISISKI